MPPEHEGKHGSQLSCGVCARGCAIRPRQTGYCGVRRNTGEKVELTTYGKFSSVNLDPIEKKPFNHFWPGSLTLSLGSVGCNFRCAGCQNWQIACPTDPEEIPTISLEPARVVEMAKEARAQGISFTYNEPVIWLEFALDCARLATRAGLYTNLVTNGYMSDRSMDAIGEIIDALRIDVKGDQNTYDTITTGVDAAIVRRNAQRTRKMGRHLEIITNLIPGISDGEDMLRDIARWIRDELGAETPWHLTRFHPARNLRRILPTPTQTLERGAEIAREEGLAFVYLGNVSEHKAESTWCPGCGGIVIRRTIEGTAEVHLKDGACAACGRPIPVTGPARITQRPADGRASFS